MVPCMTSDINRISTTEPMIMHLNSQLSLITQKREIVTCFTSGVDSVHYLFVHANHLHH